MLALAGPPAAAQVTGALPDSYLMRPELDGDPRVPPRFRRPTAAPAVLAERAGEAPAGFYRPAFGAGEMGFDSTGARKAKDKGKAKGKAAPKAKTTTPPSAAGLP